MKSNITRREFLTKTAIATVGVSAIPLMSKTLQSNDIVNIGIIGTGDRGAELVKIASQVHEIRVIACCDVLPEHLQDGLQYAAKGAKGYSDYKEMLKNRELDAVIVCTPLYLHYQMSIDALDAGKHVYCEKTMTHTIEQAIQLVQKVKDSKKTFQVGYQLPYNPLYQEIKEMITAGACGQITQIACTYNRNGDWRREVIDPKNERLINWRMYWEYSGGLMAELCSHQIGIVNWILNAHPLKVCGFGGIDYWKDGREIFDNVTVVYDYPNGVKASFNSITTNAQSGVSIKMMGTEGTIEITKEEGQEAIFYTEDSVLKQTKKNQSDSTDAISSATLKAWKQGKGVEIKVDNQPSGDFITTGLAFKHFTECILKNSTPIVNVESGRQAAISVHMANIAMKNENTEYWKDEYSV
ncbi:MAG: Gfo/Idh/MocA family oxidoreductase [Melioribacteraceae bacterium]